MVKRVLAFGTFDKLHEGHRFYLQAAAALGEALYVLVACDQAVMWAKGRPPAQPASQRLAAVAALPFVTRAWIGEPVTDLRDYLRPIRLIKPDIVALGYDQALDIDSWLNEAVTALRPRLKIVRLTAFHPEKYKSSIINHRT